MDISNAIVLSRKKSTKFLGEVYAYQSNEEVIVEGILTGGLSLSDYSTGHRAEESISVNGQNFGTGVVKSATVTAKNQGGLDQRLRVTFEIFKQGSSASLGNEYPSISAANFKYIKSFSENISCDTSEFTQSYTHSVNVKLTKYDNTGLTTAKAIASDFLNHSSLVAASTVPAAANYTVIPAKTFFDETYDEVNSECNFSKKYEVAIDADGASNASTATCILFRSSSLTYDTNGVATVTENAEYQDLTGNGAPTSTAVGDMQGAYSRCQQILTGLTGSSTNIGTMTLINIPLVKSLNIDNDTRKVSYSVNFTTNIKINSPEKVYHEFTNTVETTNAGIKYCMFEGNIIGMEEIKVADGESTKYKNAQVVWKNVAGGTWPSHGGTVTMQGKPHSFSTNHNQLKGTISYNIKYSDCSSIIEGAGTIRRVLNKVSTQPISRELAQTFRVINSNELLQKAINGNLVPQNHIGSSAVNGDSTVQMKDLIGSVQGITVGSINYGQSVSLSYNSTSRQLNAVVHVIIP
jgi:hypothetical protein